MIKATYSDEMPTPSQRLSMDETSGDKEKSKSLVMISSPHNNSDELVSKDVNKKSKKDKRVTLKSTENLQQQQSMSKLNNGHKSHSNLSTEVLSTATTTSTGAETNTSKFFNYSTVVLFGSFISYMLASLLSSCFGVFFENMESDLGWSKSKVAFIGGLISALQDLSGPISSALTNEYGCRKTAFIGGFIAGLGMIGSAYAEDFWLLGFLMGGVSGFGSSLVLVSSVVVVTYYFEEKPSFAAGLTISGGSLGQSIFSLIIIQLNEIYGRSGCFLILGGILLNMCVCACLFRPLKWELEGEDDEEDDDDDDDDDEEDSSLDDDEGESSLDDEHDQTGVKNSPKSLVTSQSHTSFSEKESTQKSVPRAIMDSVSYLNEIGSSSSHNRLAIDSQSIRSQVFDHEANRETVDSRPNDNNHEEEIYGQRIRSIFLDFDDLDNRTSHRQPNSSLASTISLKSVDQLLNTDDGDQLFVVSGPKDLRPDLARFHSLEFNNKGKMMLSLSNGNIVDDGGVPSAAREIDAQRKCNSMIVMPNLNNDDSIHFYRSVGVSPTPNDDGVEEVVDANGSTILLQSGQQIEPMGDKQYQDENQNEYVIVDADDMDNSNLILDDIYLRMMSEDKSKEPETDGVEKVKDQEENSPKESEIAKKETTSKSKKHRDHHHNASSSEQSRDLPRQDGVVRLKMESSMDQSSFESGANTKKQSFLSLLFNKLKRKQKSPTPNTVNSSPAANSVIGGSKKFKEPVSGTVAAQNQLSISAAKSGGINRIPGSAASNRSSTQPNQQVANPNTTTNARAKRYYIAKCSCSKKQQLQLQSKQTGVVANTSAGGPGTSGSFKTSGTTKFRHLPSCPLYYLKRIQQPPQLGQQASNGNRQYYVIRRGQNPVFAAGHSLGFVQQLPLASTNQAFYPTGHNNSGHMPIYLQQKHSFHKSPVNPQFHHYHKANLYRVPSLFQDSYKVPLHFRNVYYYKSLLNLNMRLMVLRPHGAGALTIVHKTNPPQSLDPSAHASRVDSNNISISCPDLQPKQVLVVKKSDKMTQQQAGGTSQATTSTATDAMQSIGPTTSAASNNNVRVLYPVLTIKELKQLKQHARQYTANMNRLKFKQQIQQQSDVAPGTSGANSELKSFSGAQVLNVGSILLRASESEKPTSSGVIRASRKDSVRLSALLATDKTTGKELTSGKEVKLDNAKNSDDEDSEEDDSEDEDESDEENEDCDNCFTRTKLGNLIYKYVYKPVARPIKFIYYSTLENIKLFRLFKFCLFALCNFILSFFYEAPFYFINSYMVESGSTPNQAGTITVAVGIVSVFSSIVYGYIGDSKRVNPIILYSISLILCGLCCVAIPFFITSYAATMVLMILIGALISVSDVLVPIICVNIVGYDDFVNAYGLMFFCQGLASFSGPPVLGLIVDGSGSYHLSYYLIGSGICTSGLVISLILVYDKVKRRAALKKAGTNDSNVIEAAATTTKLIDSTSGTTTGSRSHLKKLIEEEDSS